MSSILFQDMIINFYPSFPLIIAKIEVGDIILRSLINNLFLHLKCFCLIMVGYAASPK